MIVLFYLQPVKSIVEASSKHIHLHMEGNGVSERKFSIALYLEPLHHTKPRL